MSKFIKSIFDYEPPCLDMVNDDVCVPDQALSIREVLERYKRENKPLPTPVDYDISTVEKEYHDIQIPINLSRADALHLMDLTRAHMNKLEYQLRKTADSVEVVTPAATESAPKPDEGAE